jgi:uncharacterized delta-60 repeat protein
VQPDGKILVGGYFTQLGDGASQALRNRIGRINSDGSLDTSFDPGTDGVVLALALQADRKILVGGYFKTLGGGGTGTTSRANLGRLNPDGSVDTSFDPGVTGEVHSLVVQPDGKILVGGQFTTLGGGGAGTTTRHNLGRLNADGSLDTSFDPGANNAVRALALHSRGRILVAGSFTTLGGGGTGTTAHGYIGRLDADGSVDTTFNPGVDGEIMAMVVQANGRVVVGGYFATIGGSPRSYIGRINANGSVDADFNPGADYPILALAAQADGKILAGGFVRTLGGSPRWFLGRLNANGSLDTGFDIAATDWVLAIAVQADGKILVGGWMTAFVDSTGTVPRSYLGRLNPGGSLDTSFNPGADFPVRALAVQADRKILVGGGFTMLGGGGTGTTPRYMIGRLDGNGSLDPGFDPGVNGIVSAFAVQPDGKIVVGGYFTTLGNGGTTARNYLGRLNADGSLDTSFNPGANYWVDALAVQADGKILVGGEFTGLGGGTGTTPRNYIGRLNADGSIDTTFNPGADAWVRAIAVQADGKIVVGGSFASLGGGGTGLRRDCIGRINANGSIDPGFDPGASGQVVALAVDPNGRILVHDARRRRIGYDDAQSNRPAQCRRLGRHDL